MSRNFTSSVAVTALIALLAGPALAETAAPAQTPAPAATAEAAPAPAKAAVVLPQILRDAGLTDVVSKEVRRGQRLMGKLPDGTVLDVRLDDKGELRGLRTRDAALPAALIERVVSQPVRDQQIFAEFKQIDAIFLNREGVMLSGKDAQAKPVRAAFAEDGTLLRFGRGMERDRDRDDHRRDHDDKGGKKADRGDHDGHGMKAPKGEAANEPDDGAAQLTPDQIRASLTDAGYTEIGQILQQGRATIAQATNPEGEQVLIQLDPKGGVMRELNR